MKKQRLFVAYAGEGGVFGNLAIDDANPPRNYEEVRMVQEQIKKLHGISVVVINWIVIYE